MTDIVIIGGGIAGLSAAAHLAPHASVRLLERESQLAYHASGRSAAMYLSCYGNAAVRALNEASADGHNAAGVLSPRGMLKLGKAGQEERLTQEAQELAMEQVSLDVATARFPILNRATVTRAAWLDGAQALDTDVLCQYYRRSAQAAGAMIETGHEVHTITRPNRWHLQTDHDMIQADLIVNAAGAWADQIADMAGLPMLGLRPLRRSMAVLPAPKGYAVADWPFTEAAGESWYAKPEGGRLVVSPSEEDPVPPQDAYADDMVIAEGLARFQDMVTSPVTRVETTWAGLRTMSPDRALVLGRDPQQPDFIWCAGQGGYGFQSAPAAAQLITDIALGRAPQIGHKTAKSLSPARFACSSSL